MSFLAQAAMWQRAYSRKLPSEVDKAQEVSYTKVHSSTAEALNRKSIDNKKKADKQKLDVSAVTACEDLKTKIEEVKSESPQSKTLAKFTVFMVAKLWSEARQASIKLKTDTSSRYLQIKIDKVNINELHELLRALGRYFVSIYNSGNSRSSKDKNKKNAPYNMIPFLVAPGCKGKGEYAEDFSEFCDKWISTPSLVAVLLVNKSEVTIFHRSSLNNKLFVVHKGENPSVQFCMATLKSNDAIGVDPKKYNIDTNVEILDKKEVVTKFQEHQSQVDSWMQGMIAIFESDKSVEHIKNIWYESWLEEDKKLKKEQSEIRKDEIRFPLLKSKPHVPGILPMQTLTTASTAQSYIPIDAGFSVYGWKQLSIEADTAKSNFHDLDTTWLAFYLYSMHVMQSEKPPFLQESFLPSDVLAKEQLNKSLQTFIHKSLTSLAGKKIFENKDDTSECLQYLIEKHYLHDIEVSSTDITYAMYEAAMQWIGHVLVGHLRGFELLRKNSQDPSWLISKITKNIAFVGRQAARQYLESTSSDLQPPEKRKNKKSKGQGQAKGKGKAKAKEAATVTETAKATATEAETAKSTATETTKSQTLKIQAADDPQKIKEISDLEESADNILEKLRQQFVMRKNIKKEQIEALDNLILCVKNNILGLENFNASLDKLFQQGNEKNSRLWKDLMLVVHPDKIFIPGKDPAQLSRLKTCQDTFAAKLNEKYGNLGGEKAERDIKKQEKAQKRKASQEELKKQRVKKETSITAAKKYMYSQIAPSTNTEMITKAIHAIFRYIAIEIAQWEWSHWDHLDHARIATPTEIDRLSLHTIFSKYQALLIDASSLEEEQRLRNLERKESAVNSKKHIRIQQNFYKQPKMKNVNLQKFDERKLDDHAKMSAISVDDDAKKAAVDNNVENEVKRQEIIGAIKHTQDSSKDDSNEHTRKLKFLQLTSLERALVNPALIQAKINLEENSEEWKNLLRCLQEATGGELNVKELIKALIKEPRYLEELSSYCKQEDRLGKRLSFAMLRYLSNFVTE